jgi:hypothetical protein
MECATRLRIKIEHVSKLFEVDGVQKFFLLMTLATNQSAIMLAFKKDWTIDRLALGLHRCASE